MKRALADILWEAANECLSCDDQHVHADRLTEGYSCAAVGMAAGYGYTRAMTFLRSLGCDTQSHTALTDDPWVFTPEVQGVRYMWLLLAMHVAEDEKIYVEHA